MTPEQIKALEAERDGLKADLEKVLAQNERLYVDRDGLKEALEWITTAADDALSVESPETDELKAALNAARRLLEQNRKDA